MNYPSDSLPSVKCAEIRNGVSQPNPIDPEDKSLVSSDLSKWHKALCLLWHSLHSKQALAFLVKEKAYHSWLESLREGNWRLCSTDSVSISAGMRPRCPGELCAGGFV